MEQSSSIASVLADRLRPPAAPGAARAELIRRRRRSSLLPSPQLGASFERDGDTCAWSTTAGGVGGDGGGGCGPGTRTRSAEGGEAADTFCDEARASSHGMHSCRMRRVAVVGTDDRMEKGRSLLRDRLLPRPSRHRAAHTHPLVRRPHATAGLPSPGRVARRRRWRPRRPAANARASSPTPSHPRGCRRSPSPARGGDEKDPSQAQGQAAAAGHSAKRRARARLEKATIERIDALAPRGRRRNGELAARRDAAGREGGGRAAGGRERGGRRRRSRSRRLHDRGTSTSARHARPQCGDRAAMEKILRRRHRRLRGVGAQLRAMRAAARDRASLDRR